MRIHLSLKPELFAQPQPVAGSSNSPLVQIGGDLVLIELQGELSWEGDKTGAVVGVLGFDRPDKPTLHLGEHHLLHGKIANLQKPLAVIRRVLGKRKAGNDGTMKEGEGIQDDDEEISDEDVGRTAGAGRSASREPQGKRRKSSNGDETDDEEAEDPLFPPSSPPRTPAHSQHISASSSPFLPPSSMRDYSSELDPSSPIRGRGGNNDDDEEEEEDIFADEKALAAPEKEKRRQEKIEQKRLERRLARPERTRSYEVVAVVRKKVVFALRPEPIVTATVLPK